MFFLLLFFASRNSAGIFMFLLFEIEYNIFKRQYTNIVKNQRFSFFWICFQFNFICGNGNKMWWTKNGQFMQNNKNSNKNLVCWISFKFGVLFKSNNFGALLNYLDSILMRFYLILFAAAVVVCLISHWFMHKIPNI